MTKRRRAKARARARPRVAPRDHDFTKVAKLLARDEYTARRRSMTADEVVTKICCDWCQEPIVLHTDARQLGTCFRMTGNIARQVVAALRAWDYFGQLLNERGAMWLGTTECRTVFDAARLQSTSVLPEWRSK